MNAPQGSSYSIIVISFVLALVLSILPLPAWAETLRPQWLLLVLIYWSLISPQQVGITTGWFTGLLLDVMTGTLLGAHAMSLALVAYITMNIYQRARIFPLWQQSLLVFALALLEHLIQYWIMGITQKITPGFDYWLAPVVALLLWPWLFILLSELQHRLRGNI